MRSRWKVVLAYSLALLGTVGCSTLRSQRVSPYPAGDSVAQYLMAGHPRWELASYRIFSELRYPIPDQRSLHVQLDSFSHRSARDSVDRLAVDLIRVSLSPFDFPLRNWRSGADAFGSGIGIGRFGWGIGGGRGIGGFWEVGPDPAEEMVHGWLVRLRQMHAAFCRMEANRAGSPGTPAWIEALGRCMASMP